MIRKTALTLNILFATILILSGCTKAPPSAPSEHGDLSLFRAFCTECHSAEQVMGKEKSIDEWKAVTRKMSERRFEQFGEGIPEETQDEIIRYLTEEQE